jgi:hypothetical protein
MYSLGASNMKTDSKIKTYAKKKRKKKKEVLCLTKTNDWNGWQMAVKLRV